MRIVDGQGQAVTLDRVLGKGGEGAVYAVVGRDDLVAKIYHKPVDGEKAAKIAAMARLRTDRLLRLAAWPVSTLHEGSGGTIKGLLMPRVSGYREIHALYSPKDRLNNFPDAGWAFLIHAAANLARAFAVVHEHGHVIGDVNQGNVVVSKQATVKLIDCDSFQVADQGRHYLCEVGVATHTPPELQGQSFRGKPRNPNHDAFGLAVLIFQLLFLGRHPFSGRFLGQGEMPLEKAIAQHRFAYGPEAASRQMHPPPGTPPLDAASPAVAALLRRAFSPGSTRPKPQEWVTALTQLEGALRRCSRNTGHEYFQGITSCPWCAIETGGGIRLFRVIVAGQWQASNGTFDLQAIWAQIQAVPVPPAAEFVDHSSAVLAPSPEAERAGHRRRVRQGAVWGISVVIAGLIVAGGIGWWVAIIILVFAAGMASTGDEEPRNNAERQVKEAEQQFQALKEQWKRETSATGFEAKMRELDAKRQEYLQISAVRQQKLQDLEHNREKHQRDRYLDGFHIAHAQIPGIGPGRAATLESYGIETAVDVVESRVLAVPGFGPTFTSKLMAWRRSLEKGFVYNPNKAADPADVTAIENEIAAKRAKLEQDLRHGPAALAQIRTETLNARERLRPILENTARAVAQAKADRKAIG